MHLSLLALASRFLPCSVSAVLILQLVLVNVAQGSPLVPGDVLTVDGKTGDVIRVDPVTGDWEVFASGGFLSGGSHGIAVSDGGAIFVASQTQCIDRHETKQVKSDRRREFHYVFWWIGPVDMILIQYKSPYFHRG